MKLREFLKLNWKKVLLFVILIIIISLYILDKITSVLNKEICDPELSLFRSTEFLIEDQLVELVGIYNSDSLELVNYDPQPCLQWMETQYCQISYWEKDDTGKMAMREFVCPENVKSNFLDRGSYWVDKSCCINNGNCKLISETFPPENYSTNQLCVVRIEEPQLKKACYTLPIKLDKPLKNIENNNYVYIKGYLSSPFKFPGEKLRFVINVDSYERLPIEISPEQAINVCKKNLLQNIIELTGYCYSHGFSCDITRLIGSITTENTKLSTNKYWIVSIPIGEKYDFMHDLRLNLNFVCVIDPYSGKLIKSITCSRGSCIICEP